jgi:GNAT superfamily N-acetyltransferase
MKNDTFVSTKKLLFPADHPQVEGLNFRRFRGEDDYAVMLDIINSVKAADGDERSDRLEDIANGYAHLVNCDPNIDLIFAEMNDVAIGYGRTWWRQDLRTQEYVYEHFVFLKPVWRGKGIGTSMSRYLQERAYKTAENHDADAPKVLQTAAAVSATWLVNLYTREGYTPFRNFFEMTRDLSQPVEERPKPDGMEIRPVTEGDLPRIYEADVAAFRDHWGFSEPDPKHYNYAARRDDPDWDPSLWKVAWQGDKVAGMVGNFVNQAENEEYGRKRGYTEAIWVTKEFRKRGLASYLISESLKMFQEQGYEHAALGVDAENLTGALEVYKRQGFVVSKTNTIFRKPLD